MTLRAKRVTADTATEWMARFEAEAPHASFCGSLAWTQSARDVAPECAAIGVLLHDEGTCVGATILLEAANDWRSGSPGARRIEWPMQAFGYGFTPHASVDRAIPDWPNAIRALFDQEHLELRHSALPPTHGSDAGCRVGPDTWAAPVADEGSWRSSLQGRHRRDLDYYDRRIMKRGGRWFDLAPDACTDTVVRELRVCMDLHTARITDKGQQSAYLAAPGRAFLHALVQGNPTLRRVSRLVVDGEDVASVLSFCYAGHYQCFLPSFSPHVRGLDLGRQGIYHQIRQEFGRGLQRIDLLGGDLPYKAEFGLSPHPTWDIVHRPTRIAALREQVVTGARRAYQRIRS